MNIDRRSILGSAAALAFLPTTAIAQRLIPQRPSRRVIVDNDFAGDPDSLAALAHQLLTPKARTVLVTTTTNNPKFASFGPAKPALAGRNIAMELIKLTGIAAPPPVVAGPESFAPAPVATEAARAIVAEAMRDDKLPLFLTCGGPLTNVAAALRIEPRIASRMTVVWIGGGPYPAGAWEYNLATDVDAAREVIEKSHIPLWQVPQSAYRQMQFSIAELTARLRPISPLTHWLYDQFTSPPPFIDVGGSWPLGDSPLVLLSSISTESSHSRDVPARRIRNDLSYGEPVGHRTVRVFDELDARLTFDDMLALFELNARNAVAS